MATAMTTAEDDYPPEKLAALRTVRKLVEFWDIQPEELHGPLPIAAPAPAVARPPRYRHPVHGATWDGTGEHPQWLRDALLKEGYTVEELRRAVLVDVSEGANGHDGVAAADDPASSPDESSS